ncbi:S-adenosyl-L-methionine-dependent methyltransferase [Mycotypha africana]|uniref:S-adenosyl-L-methionine-dependent methyltransferase n=1 Tax=Mycotypha africana TaxID=64632 RepID=UPI0022FFF75A|nr:S-adenosyl-L-methionine-dependent methyltransferase [Mycotypha africana]KAI8987680.1 S-adenosyl-L-methionine-dependent methyltransferase [Mycotypha africana]
MTFLICTKKSLTHLKKFIRNYSSFQYGDFCMLRQTKSNKTYFVGPLEAGNQKSIKGVPVYHDEIVGKRPRTVLTTESQTHGFLIERQRYMLHFPTLDEYVVNVPRACTPIYPKDASAIVQLLDLEPGHKVIEAGTGNGSLSLYMARAVAGKGEESDSSGRIDSFDVRENHSKTAKKHIERYARRRYSSIISLHIGSVADKLSEMMMPNEQYDAVALDMPEPNAEIPRLLPYLKNDRFIVCYLPNITQVLSLAKCIIDLPLVLEDCIETEWKEWEVRATHIRSKLRERMENNISTEDMDITAGLPTDAWVCRPKNFDVKGHTAFLVKLRKAAPIIT